YLYGQAGNDTLVAGGTGSINNLFQDDAGAADTTAPTVSISAPADGQTVSGTISLQASAADNVGVTKVSYYVDGAFKGSAAAAPYSLSLDTSALANGSHYVQAVANDAAGNVGASAAVSFTVNNVVADSTPPTVSIGSP